MKQKVYIITKTHLDLGFTDFASNIVSDYVNKYIPKAIDIAKELNQDKKRFVWTTGSWILDVALKIGSKEQVFNLTEALKRGDIVSHAMPFTTHTELMDELTFRDGLDIIKRLDKISGKTTVAAKLTDVPGHTIAMVPILQEYGIKMLHIGVNEASAIPDIPRIFLWKYKGSEVVVVYDASYGGEITLKHLNSVAVFCHTSDNVGPVNLEQAKANYKKYSEKYPDAEVFATGLDEFANDLFEIRHLLPVVTSEIGDSWIHGSTTDPYKAAAQRELMELKRAWLEDGTLTKSSEEYQNFSNAVLMLAEHTNGGDIKRMLSDYSNYLKKDFEKARALDKVQNDEEVLKMDGGIVNEILKNEVKDLTQLSYKKIEKSWEERRGFIDLALNSLSEERREVAKVRLKALRPQNGFYPPKDSTTIETNQKVNLGKFQVLINKFGGINVVFEGSQILDAGENESLVEYVSHSVADVEEFFETYNRKDIKDVYWAHADFGRPGISRWDGKFPAGRFKYEVNSIKLFNNEVYVSMATKLELSQELGAPREITYKISTKDNLLVLELIWTGKDANRIQEETLLRLHPVARKENIRLNKLGSYVNPYDVVASGNRSNSAIMFAKFENENSSFKITSKHCPLFSLGKGKIMKFDNVYEDIKKDGITFILHNNIWGTNFPLWYSDNAYFKFEIKVDC
ncbi:MAG TPA: DUF5054 domain-containing protein [Clostridia bacterium]|jgi:hypothetical protein|nr:DUF5054 domain-containing protein [Clostridia bacterium]